METSISTQLSSNSLALFCLKRSHNSSSNQEYEEISNHSCQGWDYVFQWTVAEYCCYDDDELERNPHCCSSELYKLVITLAPVCISIFILMPLIILGCCWYFEWIPGLVHCLTCGVIKMKKRKRGRSKRKTAKTSPDLYSDRDSVSGSVSSQSVINDVTGQEVSKIAVIMEAKQTVNFVDEEQKKWLNGNYLPPPETIEPQLSSIGELSEPINQCSGTSV